MSDTLTKRHLRFMSLASKMARDLAPEAGARVAAIIAVRNDVIAVGHNIHQSHPFAARFAKNSEAIYFHAETYAIAQAIKAVGEDELLRLRTTLYICRMKRLALPGRPWVWALCEPCIGCWAAIKTYNIQHVVHSLESEQGETNHRIIHDVYHKCCRHD
jgi:tRNA(Arg) A34 adenosine deaminase TadA